MHKYIVVFSKTGTVCYISHLDLMRFFKRAFKKADVRLVYSQGFNPHPKMGFGQPLSLGYSGLNEMIEFETEEDYEPDLLLRLMRQQMPDGLELKSCRRADDMKKTLASMTDSAQYIITIPLREALEISADEMKRTYMCRETITALKKQKKKKEPVSVDIKPMIRDISFTVEQEALFITADLDSGSTSNLSPELVIKTVTEELGLDVERGEIEVVRTLINFHNM
ncbi:MAG: DUF2344 domain-containing protein [Clostridiales bacterium]|nr:DUF2344 domain-containing protein [Clostridiales bacterium]